MTRPDGRGRAHRLGPMDSERPGGLLQLADAATAHLSRRLPPRLRADGTARPAGVLVLFGPADDAVHAGPDELPASELDVVLQVRAASLRTHAGEVAFPGGGADPGDADIVATALRETEEEIGFRADEVQVLGTLPELGTVSDYRVTPVLGWRTTTRASAPVDPRETAAVLRVPVAWLLDPANRYTSVLHHEMGEFRGPAWDLGEATLWGFTAFIMSDLFDAAGWTIPWDASVERPLPGR